MGGSTIENTDQDMSAADELVAGQLVGDLEGPAGKLGEGEGQACAERELQRDFVDEL